MSEMISKITINNVLETRCGEGYVSQFLYEKGYNIDAFDVSKKAIQKAKNFFQCINFFTDYIYKIFAEDNKYDLVVASEVLEHLEKPEKALNELLRVSKKYVFVSVSNEPIWRVLNLVRGKYIKDFGNTPGHIQYWSCNRI